MKLIFLFLIVILLIVCVNLLEENVIIVIGIVGSKCILKVKFIDVRDYVY